MKAITLTLLLILFYSPLFSQSSGYYDDFEDGLPDSLWKADHPATFGISEDSGSLKIAYDRSAASGAWDNFNFTPPQSIDVLGNPVIVVKVRSDVTNTFTVKPIYSNGNDGWLQKTVPADNKWHTYSYELQAANYTGGNLEKIYFYFDGGSSDIKAGTVRFDFFQIAGFSIQTFNLQASLVDSATIHLSWDSDDPENTEHFNIYRSTEKGFSADSLTKIAESTETLYQDTGLLNHTTYYYKVSATDVDGREHVPAEVSLRTFNPGSAPLIVIESENANPVNNYEKYELSLKLEDATFENPYNPEELDLYAWFYSPAGDSVKMNGFYDNYQEQKQWKIRFAADQTGQWEYQVFARDEDGTGFSDRRSFTVLESDNKGWLHISPDNPNYLMHDDGSSFYGISVYYPWNVTQAGLDAFAEVSGNFFGYWDCTFDYSGNGGGKYLLESMESGVGRYDQRKAARIDEVLSWAEARDMKVMLAMWTHGYLRIEGVPWDNGLWFSHNPYSQMVDIDDFYTDSLALAYQEKHYRYMIARWGYSQSLGIWEIINEMHGTTGWVRDRTASKKWVEDVHAYFKENDPYQRPTTASFGGGEGASHFTETDQLGDMPNVHFYEKHGWPTLYPNNLIRSGLANVVNETRLLKTKGDRPAFFGEAGYTSMLTNHLTESYTWELHNSFWAGLTNGMASTPFWWEFNTTDVLSNERLQEYHRFSNFVKDIDFAHQVYDHVDIEVDNKDGYFMGAPTGGFGWMKSYDFTAVSNTPIRMYQSNLGNGNYTLEWFNTWTGEITETDTALAVDGITWAEVTGEIAEADVAFKLVRMEGGSDSNRVNLYILETDSLAPAKKAWQANTDSIRYKIICYVSNDDKLLDTSYDGAVEISLEGEGQAEPFSLDLKEGGVVFDYKRLGSTTVTMTASIEGLNSDELFFAGSTGMDKDHPQFLPEDLQLKNFPNPITQGTTIEYVLPIDTHVKLSVYNSQGNLVEVLTHEMRPAGLHQVLWNTECYQAGLYFYKLSSDQFSASKRCVILK